MKLITVSDRFHVALCYYVTIEMGREWRIHFRFGTISYYDLLLCPSFLVNKTTPWTILKVYTAKETIPLNSNIDNNNNNILLLLLQLM